MAYPEQSSKPGRASIGISIQIRIVTGWKSCRPDQKPCSTGITGALAIWIDWLPEKPG
jgi:hypothetical protein